jgi:hypothetical protein
VTELPSICVTDTVHLRQVWPGHALPSEGTIDLPALEYTDRVNWALRELHCEIVVLSDGLTSAPAKVLDELVAHAAGWGTATIARDDSCPPCRLAAIPRDVLIEVGGLNPAITAFYWLDDLARRLPSVSYKFVAVHDLRDVREEILLDFAVEAVRDLDRLDQPL